MHIMNNKKKLLQAQIDKINEVVATLQKDFPEVDFTDEVSFLPIVSDNINDALKEIGAE